MHVTTHITEGFQPTDQWLLLNNSQMCPTCKTVIVSLTSRCNECKTSTPEAPSAPRAQHLPSLHKNYVVQLSLGTNNEKLSAGLAPVAKSDAKETDVVPEGDYYVEKIIDRRRKHMKLEY